MSIEPISNEDFTFLRDISEEWMGSVFEEDKKYLFETRLINMAKKFNFASTKALILEMKLKRDRLAPSQKDYFIDIITTHETLFFRDKSPFKNLKDIILPDLLKNKSLDQELNLYSAACSTGQEAISLAIALNEALPLERKGKFRIQASDISQMAIDYAKAGVYSQYEVQRGMPTKLLNKYFTQHDTCWKVKPEFLKYITYQQENLIKPDFKFRKFDVILCRNATIYMDKPKVRKIYEHFHDNLHPYGYFLVGHSERLSDHGDLFEYVRTPAGILHKKKS